MNQYANDILLILQSCDTIKELNAEFNKPFGWLKIKEKKACKDLKNKLIEKIKSLDSIHWNIDYLTSMQAILLSYRYKLEFYLEEIYFSDLNDNSINSFQTMYFSDIVDNRERIIMLDIISNNISFTIFDVVTGNKLESISSNETSSNQMKIESVCKQKIIDMLLRYLEDSYNSNIDTSKYLEVFSNNYKKR